MTSSLQKSIHFSRLLMTCACGAVCLAVVAAPVLAARSHALASALLYLVFSPVCHQLSDRSFFLCGYPWAVCHRCAGIYWGMFCATFIPFSAYRFLCSLRIRRIWALSASVVLALDLALPVLGLWHNSPTSRFATGILFGSMLTSLLVPGLAELRAGATRGLTPARASVLHGGIT
jgi:uncharacterized membrane protein